MYLDDQRADNNEDIAQLFANYFSTIYLKNENAYNNNNTYKLEYDIPCPRLSLELIFNKITGLANKYTVGPDGIPNTFLKNCKYSLTLPLYLIFDLSLKSGIFPYKWKQSFIMPIFKSGSKEDVRNYRSVCIQSSIPKMFDSLIYDQLSFSCKEIIIDNQHGFSTKRSTVTNLLIFNDRILNAFENGCQMDTIYTDFSRAFDRVDHDILLDKLDRMGFSKDILRWLSSFLKGRTQKVKIGSNSSDDIEVLSGVPQGSHCAPLLFNLFINDIGRSLKNCEYLLFADDLKMFKCINSAVAQLLLQEDLDNLAEWCYGNKLHLNPDKCTYISFFRGRKKYDTSYFIGETKLNPVTSIKDLGVILDTQLNFAEHIQNMVAKASKTLGVIL